MKAFVTGAFACYLGTAFLFGTMAYNKTGSLVNAAANGAVYPAKLLALTYFPELAGPVNKVAALH